MIQCALRTKIEHISALSAFRLAALFLYHDICGVAFIEKKVPRNGSNWKIVNAYEQLASEITRTDV